MASACDDTRGTPAALQIASQMPLSFRSGCASGSQIRPANAASTAMAAVTPTLALNQRIAEREQRLLAHRLGSDIDRGHVGFLQHHQLRDRIAVIDDGEPDHQRKPQPKAVQRGRDPRRHVQGHGEPVGARLAARAALAADQHGEKQDARDQQNEAADRRHRHRKRLRRDRRIGVVVERHAARHAEDADIMPRERGDDHADEPQPELGSHQAEAFQRAAGEMRPQIIGDREIHDDDGAAEDQVEMPGDPLRVVDAGIELIAHVDQPAGAAEAEHDQRQRGRQHDRILPGQRADPSERAAGRRAGGWRSRPRRRS